MDESTGDEPAADDPVKPAHDVPPSLQDAIDRLTATELKPFGAALSAALPKISLGGETSRIGEALARMAKLEAPASASMTPLEALHFTSPEVLQLQALNGAIDRLVELQRENMEAAILANDQMKVLVAATQQANDTAVQQERTSRRVAYAAIAISVLGILVGAGVSIAIAILKT